MIRVLFVCTGNICRSPTAEGVLRHRIACRGLEARIAADSAGTTAAHQGEGPDPRSIEAAKRRGVDLTGLRARRVCAGDFMDFDFILAMDNSHYDALLRMAKPDSRAAIGRLMDYVPDVADKGIPDPYYGSNTDFELVLDLVERGVDGLLNDLGL